MNDCDGDDGNGKAINLKLQLPPWQWLPQDSLGCSRPLGHPLQHPPWFKVNVDDDYNDDDVDWDVYHGNQKLATINLFKAAATSLSYSWPKVIIIIIIIIVIVTITMIIIMIMIMVINLFKAAATSLTLSLSWPKVISFTPEAPNLSVVWYKAIAEWSGCLQEYF